MLQISMTVIIMQFITDLAEIPIKVVHHITEKKDGAKTVPFGNRFEKWCPF